MLAGFLPGAIIAGVMLATASANTGGAWDNAKKYISSYGILDEQGVLRKKGSEQYKAAVVGDTVGDPLKDTSGPALNILMKIMAIISLIFGSKFTALHPII
jgi:Na+/H+-translocating membrane pyrophosphatase